MPVFTSPEPTHPLTQFTPVPHAKQPSLTTAPPSGFTGIGLQVKKQKNVIIRNIKSASVVAANGDALTIDVSQPQSPLFRDTS